MEQDDHKALIFHQISTHFTFDIIYGLCMNKYIFFCLPKSHSLTKKCDACYPIQFGRARAV